MQDNFNFPRQRISYKEKTKNDYQWCKDMIDNLTLNYAESQGYTTDEYTDYYRKLSNYQLYNNILNQRDFERECNPMGLDVGQFKDEIKPYNKAYNKVQVLLGEELKRPFNYRPILINSEGIKTKMFNRDQQLKNLVKQNISQLIQTMQMAAEGQADPEEVKKAVEGFIDQKELAKLDKTTFLDSKEILASRILEYLKHQQDIRDKMNDGLKHGLLAGDEHVYVGIVKDQVTIEVLNSLGVFYHKSPEVKFVQDGLYAGYRTMMSVGDILDRFGEFLKDEDIKKMTSDVQAINGAREDLIGPQMKYHNVDIYHEYVSRLKNYGYDEGSYGMPSFGEDWLVTLVEWRSEKKVYFLTFLNEYGDEERIIVNEDFEIPNEAVRETVKGKFGSKKTVYKWGVFTAEEAWIPEIWQGVRIGDDIYCCMGPREYQLRSTDDPYNVKLSFHGVVYNNMNANPVSLMDRMKPFLYLYLIVAHKLKRLIARDKGQVFHLDLSMIPDNMDLEKVLYYLEEMDIDLFNPLQNAEKPGSYQRGKITGSTSRSNMQHIMNYVALLDAIDQQIAEVAGVTRQREGQVSSGEAVTNAQENILRSATITEATYFQPHFKLWEKVLDTSLSLAAACWQNKSILKQYILDDLSVATLEIGPSDLQNADFGVFLSNHIKDHEVFETMRAMIQPLIQNDKAKMSDIIKMIKATSTQDLANQIEASEELAMQQQQQEMQMQMQLAQDQLKADQIENEKERQLKREIALLESETDIRLKEMDMLKESGDNDDIPSELEIEKFKVDTEFKRKKLELEERKLKQASDKANNKTS